LSCIPGDLLWVKVGGETHTHITNITAIWPLSAAVMLVVWVWIRACCSISYLECIV
jgi:hypothetical protein